MANVGSTYYWGAQVEDAVFPSSPVATVGAAATRAADVLTYATNCGTWDAGSDDYTVYARIANPPARLDGSPLAEVKTMDGVKFVARDGSWLMLRGSGTEPVLRIYAEAKSPGAASGLIREGVKMTKRVA